ncbi:MAG: aliphatic sulfonates transport ATP-binding subunit [Cyanobium sp. CACIAM 14]|nr:MAG: aliphatic sulfonates transport ATP-binding subunit [Cyanobium sp. CACIAM 14]
MTHATPETGSHLHLDRLTKAYGAQTVLSGIELTIPSGHFTAIVGRSGCGKSTLLRLLSGLETSNGGDIRVGGTPLRGVNQQARIMFQDGRLLPWKTVLDNVGLGLRGDWRPRGLEVLRHVGLQERAHDWIARLSGGQRQRVALAKALITRPRLMLLDEPLGALDALTRIEMQSLIESLWLEQGFTTILVTHDVEEAVTLADRILVLEEGRIARDFANDLPRPRRRGDPGFAHLTARVLESILLRNRPSEAPPQASGVPDGHAREASADSGMAALSH